jgi:hypothetical protein
MSRESVLARGRAAAEAGMVDACTIRRSVGEATDPVSGVVTPIWQQLYAGKCRVQQKSIQAEDEDAGEARLLMVRLEVQLPMSVTDLEPDDQVLITASASDLDLPGRVFWIADLFHKTHATARRIGVIERTS